MTEKELLLKIRSDPAAFSDLFRLYYKAIFGYILRRTGDFDDTADISADTFIKAFAHINDFDYRGISVKVWLYRIATNEVNQYFRHKQNRGSAPRFAAPAFSDCYSYSLFLFVLCSLFFSSPFTNYPYAG